MESQFSLDKTLVLFRFYQKFMTVRTQHTTRPVIGEEKKPRTCGEYRKSHKLLKTKFPQIVLYISS
jgi:hypothetical protein